MQFKYWNEIWEKLEGTASHPICFNFCLSLLISLHKQLWCKKTQNIKGAQCSLACYSTHPCWACAWMQSGFGPPPGTEQPASLSTAFAGVGSLLHSGKFEGKARKGRTNSCCYCTAQEAWSIYQFESAIHFSLDSNPLDECCTPSSARRRQNWGKVT